MSIKLKQAYPVPAFAYRSGTAKNTSSKEQPGINNLEYVCSRIASGIIRMKKPTDTHTILATQIVNQATAIIEEIEKRGLDS